MSTGWLRIESVQSAQRGARERRQTGVRRQGWVRGAQGGGRGGRLVYWAAAGWDTARAGRMRAKAAASRSPRALLQTTPSPAARARSLTRPPLTPTHPPTTRPSTPSGGRHCGLQAPPLPAAAQLLLLSGGSPALLLTWVPAWRSHRHPDSVQCSSTLRLHTLMHQPTARCPPLPPAHSRTAACAACTAVSSSPTSPGWRVSR